MAAATPVAATTSAAAATSAADPTATNTRQVVQAQSSTNPRFVPMCLLPSNYAAILAISQLIVIEFDHLI